MCLPLVGQLALEQVADHGSTFALPFVVFRFQFDCDPIAVKRS